MSQYKFTENGRYEYGRGYTTVAGVWEKTTSSVSDGNYRLNGAELTLTSDTRNVSKYYVRLYETYIAGTWWRQMSLLSDDMQTEVEFERIVN